VESNSLEKQIANAPSSDRSMAVCRDVMIKLMRPRGLTPQEENVEFAYEIKASRNERYTTIRTNVETLDKRPSLFCVGF
jgi:hypothetical protein